MAKDKQSGGAWPHISKSRNSGSPSGKPGMKLVSYCPECKQEPDPRFTTNVSLSGGEKFATDRLGHTWRLRW